MTPHSIFHKATSPKESPKRTNMNSETNPQKDTAPFGVLLLGGFLDSVPSNLSSTDIFLNRASIELIGNDCYHIIHRENISFNLIIYKKADRLLDRILLPQANLIFVLPDNVEDFNRCANLLMRFKPLLQSDAKIYYLNKFTKDSHEHSLITRKAKILKYQEVQENEVKTLLENTQKEYLRKLEASSSGNITEKNTTEDKSSGCRIL